MKTLALAIILLVPAHAHAADNIFRASMVAAIAAHGADLATTEYCLGAGTCRERNPGLTRLNEPAVFGAVKMATAGAQMWASAILHDRHPKLATLINFTSAALFTGVAIHNMRVGK